MKCDHCSNPASVFLTQLVNGEMKKTMLCHACAEERGVTDPTGFALADFLSSSKDSSEPSEEALDLVPSDSALEACPNCGFTLEKLRKVGRLGCSRCYQAFRPEILPMLRNMHGASEHQGKVPELTPSQSDLEEAIKALQTKLDQAIQSEAFEEAASLRDQIRDLMNTNQQEEDS